MISAGAWRKSQLNTILFVLVDSSGVEVSGLGSAFVLQLSKAGAAFVGSAGTKAEISDGWYKYTATVGEADTIGPLAIKITHASIIQQNLEYVVETRTILAQEVTYTVTNSVTTLPIDGVYVAITTDVAGLNIIWNGYTDSFGVLRDSDGNKPYLDAPGTYYFWRQKSGFTFINPDTEVIP